MHALMAQIAGHDRTAPSTTGAADPTGALLRGVARGEHAALDALHARWFERAVGLTLSLTRRDEAFGLDVAQEVFLRLIKKPPAVDDLASLDRWMSRAVHNAAIDLLRSEAGRLRRERAAAVRESAASRDDRLALLEDLRCRVQRLDDQDRLMLAQRYGLGRQPGVIARMLGRGVGAVHGRMARALKTLGREKKDRP